MSSILYKFFEKTPYGAIYDAFTQNKEKKKEQFADGEGSSLVSLSSSITWLIMVVGALYLTRRCTGKIQLIHILFILFCPCYLLCYIIYMLVAHDFCNIL